MSANPIYFAKKCSNIFFICIEMRNGKYMYIPRKYRNNIVENSKLAIASISNLYEYNVL